MRMKKSYEEKLAVDFGQKPFATKYGQGENFDRMQGVDFEEAGASSVGGGAGTGYLGEDRESHQGRVVSLAAGVWQVLGVNAENLKC
jgi:hypothetical protein